MLLLKELRFTLVATCLAIAMVLTASFTDIDVVQINLKAIESIAKYKIDDILVGPLLIFVAVIIDLYRYRATQKKRHQAEIEAQRLETLKATMRTVQDIVNNFLNNLQAYELHQSDDSLESLQALIQATSKKLKALGDLESVRESDMAGGKGVEF